MKELAIDIETYSSVDLGKCGVYKYSESPDFRVLLFAYAIDGGAPVCIDIEQGERLPQAVRDALTDPEVVKTAFNATFERVCLSRWLGVPLMDPSQWRCTMVAAARMGLPLSLAECCAVLNVKTAKMAEGRALIRFFSVPGRSADGSLRRRVPAEAPDKWETFKAYCARDVEAEQAVLAAVRRLNVPDFDDRLYALDQRINDRGVEIDLQMVSSAEALDAEYRDRLIAEARRLTGLSNPNSTTQLRLWLEEVTHSRVESLAKNNIADLLKRFAFNPRVRRVLEIRSELGKTSNAKYGAMLDCVCRDRRIHGLLQFYGAARTGRWAGRLVQVQNLPQNHIDDLDHARSLVRRGELEDLLLEYDNPTQVLSELIRTAFVPKEDHVFHICDFSAIEARVIAWLAGENWVLDVFRNGGDIYCATASQMFGVPVEKHGANAELRQKGKIAVLALGYGGGVAALEAMGGARLGLSQAEMRDIVRRWREANPRIVGMWDLVERAASFALNGRDITLGKGLEFSSKWGCLLIKLPSGRMLCYPRARLGVEENQWGRKKNVIEYEGLDQATRKWGTQRTYGGKLVENIVQATARDILGEVIFRAADGGLDIVFHVHDEIVVEAEPTRTLEEVEALFDREIKWCPGLPLKGAGYTTYYYKKD